MRHWAPLYDQAGFLTSAKDPPPGPEDGQEEGEQPHQAGHHQPDGGGVAGHHLLLEKWDQL